MHRVAFSVDDLDQALQIAAKHGCHPLRGAATYEDVYTLAYVRGPSGIIDARPEKLGLATSPEQPRLLTPETIAASTMAMTPRLRRGMPLRPRG